MSKKHKKSDCVSFQEGGPPCEDCDLEGHAADCEWHYDWHACECGEFDRQTEAWLAQQDPKCRFQFLSNEDSYVETCGSRDRVRVIDGVPLCSQHQDFRACYCGEPGHTSCWELRKEVERLQRENQEMSEKLKKISKLSARP